ncbi:cell division protein FtsQ/DivIB [Corynebacterium diphtheriae]|uniref:Cell division protein FtsQ n=1 Tax=Corynebacterium diphtheriae bv. gravis TaxID=1720349 RepID=A0AAX0J2P6_CORDP|nr:FtsQ-type POTRA domain-containing protein [Corynebacterium diphtheriae]ERA53695.1 cell division protein [Corynebacterium diphtheriae DSM 43988]OWN09833.1 cell division protein FtsQ [Corynebacterium belfantii]AEX67786.1 putative cell division protein precursor [Corynebacterium diphtheriae C7 (beta)]AEX70236.1 putative cell division protein precursor [Corynebacterium diphtheriae PW8]KLN38665.1 cell division protein FtsQ [Corynebacterium diphtheriae bv. gravis str. ISS 4060]
MKKRIAIVSSIVLLIVAIAGGCLWAFPVMTVQKFEIDGAVRSSAEEVETASGIAKGTNIVRVAAHDAAGSVTQLPWVRSATVTRSFPNTVRIEVVERTDVGFVDRSDGQHLFDEKGRAFVIDSPSEGSVKVTGPSQDDPEVLSAVAESISAIDPGIRSTIDHIEAPDRYSLNLVLHDGRQIFWGSSESAHDKAATLMIALSRAEQRLDISGAPVIAVR